jgi:hypothetical protein
MSGESAEDDLRRLRHGAKRIDVRLTRRLDADEREQESNDEGKQGLEYRHAESGIEDCGADQDGDDEAADPPESRHLLGGVGIVILIRRQVTGEHDLGFPPTWSKTPKQWSYAEGYIREGVDARVCSDLKHRRVIHEH